MKRELKGILSIFVDFNNILMNLMKRELKENKHEFKKGGLLLKNLMKRELKVTYPAFSLSATK